MTSLSTVLSRGPECAPEWAEHQIRRLVLYVHEVLPSAVCAAQVNGRVRRVPDNSSGGGWWTATRTAMTAGSDPSLT
jgi:hypothetical protein